MSRKTALTLPAQFDKFELVRELGRGTSGVVYLAHQRNLRREVAIKILSPDVPSDDDEFVVRFRREGEIAASLRHPNIIQIFDASVFDDLYYIAMEYVPGPNLRETLLQKELLPWRQSVDICCQILYALDHAHSKGIIHRDVKPANIILAENNRAVLTDFSVAHMKAASRLTATGTVLGTPEYMAPEVFEGGLADARNDIYAVGIILYELLTGVNPFRAKSIPEVLKLQLFTIPKSPEQLNPEVPLELAQIIKSTLAKDPQARPGNAAELAKRLTRAADAVPVKTEVKGNPKIKLGDLETREMPKPRDLPEVPASRSIDSSHLPSPSDDTLLPVKKAEPPPPAPVVAKSSIEPLPAAKEAAPTAKIPAAPPEAAPLPPTPKRREVSTLWLVLLLLVCLAGVAGLSYLDGGSPSENLNEGQVVLSTVPSNITLVIDGVSENTGQKVLKLRAGNHEIKASAPGYRPWQSQLVVSAAYVSRLQIRLELQQGWVKLTDLDPAIRVLVDGSETSANTSLAMSPGPHEIKFTRPHYREQVKKVEVVDGQTLEPGAVTLEPLPATVRLSSNPEEATVTINEQDQGKAPVNVSLPPGKVTIRLSKEGYHDASEEVELEPEQVFEKTIELEKVPPPPTPTPTPKRAPKPTPTPPPPAYIPPPPRYREAPRHVAPPPRGNKINTI